MFLLDKPVEVCLHAECQYLYHVIQSAVDCDSNFFFLTRKGFNSIFSWTMNKALFVGTLMNNVQDHHLAGMNGSISDGLHKVGIVLHI